MRRVPIECVVKRLVLGAFVAAAVVCGGSKGPQMVGAIALNRPDDVLAAKDAKNTKEDLPLRSLRPLRLKEGESVSPEDIARGYRFVEEATEDVSYAMPEDGVEVGNWGKRGTFGEWLRYELGWAFPLGTNDAAYAAFSVFSDGKIRPTPRDRSHEICAVGVPMLAMQGASRFWVADGSGDWGQSPVPARRLYQSRPTSAARTNAAPSRAKRMSHEVAARPQTGAGDAPKVRARPPVCVAQVSQGASDRA